jgi:hypothetical protein
MNCDIDSITLQCVVCGARVSSPAVKRNCAAFPTPEHHHVGALHRPAAGPGTELSRLLKKIGIEPTPTCSCRAKAAEMDAWGCDEAARPERIDEVVAVMRSEAAARGLPFLDAAGRMLVRRAIANARREEARRASEKAREGSPPAV